MAIRSRSSRPDEWASKANHSHIIKDPFIQKFLDECDLPKESTNIDSLNPNLLFNLNASTNPIRYIVAVDGGYTSIQVKKSFPSSQIAFFQFGALMFQKQDLDNLAEKPFIFPEDINKLHNLKRFKLALPTKNIVSRKQSSLKNSIRKVIYDFFSLTRENSTTTFMETLKWFLFEEYSAEPRLSYTLASNPNLEVGSGPIELKKNQMNPDFTFDTLNGKVFLTDVFRLHEAIDEEHGAGGILGYITRLIEQLIIVHYIRIIYKLQPELLNEILFITDGPLSFSGQTANMHEPMRRLCTFLTKHNNLFLAGIEKSGPFVEHAQEICVPKRGIKILGKNKFLILSNEYIYKYIVPGDARQMHYGSTSYYGGKIIFHSLEGQIFVISVPVADKNIIKNPTIEDFNNLEIILGNIQKLRCHMYDDSIVPVALANKLVSLANHPSQSLLEKFALNSVSKQR